MSNEQSSKLTIDVTNIKTAKELQLLLKEIFHFPNFYGENWDAFWDAITGLVELPTTIEFLGWSNLEKILPTDTEIMKNCLFDYNQEGYLKKCTLLFN